MISFPIFSLEVDFLQISSIIGLAEHFDLLGWTFWNWILCSISFPINEKSLECYCEENINSFWKGSKIAPFNRYYYIILHILYEIYFQKWINILHLITKLFIWLQWVLKKVLWWVKINLSFNLPVIRHSRFFLNLSTEV